MLQVCIRVVAGRHFLGDILEEIASRFALCEGQSLDYSASLLNDELLVRGFWSEYVDLSTGPSNDDALNS